MRMALWFLVALAVGGVAVAALQAAGLAEGWSVVIGWAVFMVVGLVLGRGENRRRRT
jgi:hypothetical protein